MSGPDLLLRLRQALAGSSEEPRPVARIELPASLDKLMTAAAVARLESAAVLVPILCRPGGHTVLLTRRSDALRQHRGQISFPGGRRDDHDQSITEAALREAHEEVGLAPQAVELLGWLDDHPTLTGYRITPVVGLVSGAFSPVIDPGEVAETFEVPLDHVLCDDRFERKAFRRGGIDVPFLQLSYAGYAIWGATAGILWNLRECVIGHG